MKHARKMIMVPEPEYLALLSLLKSGDIPSSGSMTGDHVQAELAQLDSKIHQSLRDPTLTEDLRAHKYDWLYKKRRQLKKAVEERPQRVILVEGATGSPITANYLGVSATRPPPQLKTIQNVTTALPEMGHETRQRRIAHTRKRRRLISVDHDGPEAADHNGGDHEFGGNFEMATGHKHQRREATESVSGASEIFQSASEGEEQAYEERTPTKTRRRKVVTTTSSGISPEKPLLEPTFYHPLLRFINENREGLGIDTNGRILGPNGLPVGESSHVQILKHLTGQIDEPPKGSYYLQQRLAKHPQFASAVQRSKEIQVSSSGQQQGKGQRKRTKKHILAAIKAIKPTPGLERIKLTTHNYTNSKNISKSKGGSNSGFKPKIWAKL